MDKYVNVNGTQLIQQCASYLLAIYMSPSLYNVNLA